MADVEWLLQTRCFVDGALRETGEKIRKPADWIPPAKPVWPAGTTTAKAFVNTAHAVKTGN